MNRFNQLLDFFFIETLLHLSVKPLQLLGFCLLDLIDQQGTGWVKEYSGQSIPVSWLLPFLVTDSDGLVTEAVTAESLAYVDSDGYDGLFISYAGIRNKKYILLFACGGYKRCCRIQKQTLKIYFLYAITLQEIEKSTENRHNHH